MFFSAEKQQIRKMIAFIKYDKTVQFNTFS